ncbi:MAG: hypothetical protein J6023_05640 [Clostridia bacterium]|nr:hypothetical protein [Clostridia bacterium]
MSAKKDVKKIARLLLSIWLVSAILLNTGCSSFSDRTSVDSTESDSENATAEPADQSSPGYPLGYYDKYMRQLILQLNCKIEKDHEGVLESLGPIEAGRMVYFVQDQTESSDSQGEVTAFASQIRQGEEIIYTEPVLTIPNELFLHVQAVLYDRYFSKEDIFKKGTFKCDVDPYNSKQFKIVEGFCGSNWFMMIPFDDDAALAKILRTFNSLWYTDDGETWHEFTTCHYEEEDRLLKWPLYEVQGVCVLSEQVAFVSGFKWRSGDNGMESALIVTRDGGKTWVDLELAPTQDCGGSRISCLAFRGAYGICWAGGNSYFFTDDGGFQWTFFTDLEDS